MPIAGGTQPRDPAVSRRFFCRDRLLHLPPASVQL